MTVLLVSISGFVLACVLLFFGRKVALNLGLSDKPGGRKTHATATPLIGGLVIVPVFILSLFISGLAAEYWVLIASALVLLLMGVVDDFMPINPFVKFAVQLWIACFVVIFGGVEVTKLGNILGYGEVELWWLSKPFSVMCLVLLMNAMNMIDGLDGLSGGLSAVMLAVLMVVSLVSGAIGNVLALSLILAPILAFLIFNMRYPGHAKASVFMGDAGTLALGLIIGWFAIKYAQGAHAVITPSIVPWIVGIPVVDTFAVYLVRAMSGHNPFEPDRSHIHHRMVDSGIADGRASVMIAGFTLLTAGGAIVLQNAGVPEVVVFGSWVIFFFAHIACAFRPQCYQGLFKRFA